MTHNDYIKKEDRVIFHTCLYFKIPHGRFLLRVHNRSGKIDLIKKWTSFFLNKYTRKSYDEISGIVKISKKMCMDYVGEVGFKIKTESQYDLDFKKMDLVISKIYQNEDSKEWKVRKDSC